MARSSQASHIQRNCALLGATVTDTTKSWPTVARPTVRHAARPCAHPWGDFRKDEVNCRSPAPTAAWTRPHH